MNLEAVNTYEGRHKGNNFLNGKKNKTFFAIFTSATRGQQRKSISFELAVFDFIFSEKLNNNAKITSSLSLLNVES